jgi:hypothetical protein
MEDRNTTDGESNPRLNAEFANEAEKIWHSRFEVLRLHVGLQDVQILEEYLLHLVQIVPENLERHGG